jgi:hypothetical protein
MCYLQHCLHARMTQETNDGMIWHDSSLQRNTNEDRNSLEHQIFIYIFIITTKIKIIHSSGNLFMFVRSEVFTEVTMKNAVFWDAGPCRSCVNRRFGGTYRLHLQGKKSASEELALAGGCRMYEDGDNTFLRNVGSHKIYTAPHPGRRHSSCSCLFVHPLALLPTLVFYEHVA